jgi:hypothetical protein
MTQSPRYQNITLDPSPRERCVEVDGREPVGRKELRHPPTSSKRGGGNPNIWKISNKDTNTHDDEIDLGRPTCKVIG